MAIYDKDKVLNDIVKSFAKTIQLKVQLLRNCIPKTKSETNPDLTGKYIEEVVRGFIQSWIGHRLIVHGTIYGEEYKSSLDSFFENDDENIEDKQVEKSSQLDGIIYDPTKGPPIIKEGNFAILHPHFCDGIVEIKTSISSINILEKDLSTKHRRYLSHLPCSKVMGIVIEHSDPANASIYQDNGGNVNFYNPPEYICPIFIMFKKTKVIDYEPFEPGISGLISYIYRQINNSERI